jgi:hypothetical protein
MGETLGKANESGELSPELKMIREKLLRSAEERHANPEKKWSADVADLEEEVARNPRMLQLYGHFTEDDQARAAVLAEIRGEAGKEPAITGPEGDASWAMVRPMAEATVAKLGARVGALLQKLQ